MTAFFSEQELSFEHVKAITAAMFAVARVDGVHDREMALIRQFYESCARAGDPPLEAVVKVGLEVAAAPKLFDTPELAKLFVKNLILLAFADGSYGKAEDALIRSYASALGLSDGDVDALHEATKDFLLGSLSHVQNVGAVAQVARELSGD